MVIKERTVSLEELQKLLPKIPEIPDEEWELVDLKILIFINDYEKLMPKLEAFFADHLSQEKLKKLIEDFPECEECVVFLKTKVNPKRALICETMRACGGCPKDKWLKRLIALEKGERKK